MAISSSSRFDRAVDFLGGLKLSFVLMVLLGLLVAQRAVISQKITAGSDVGVPAFIRFVNIFGLDSPSTLAIPFAVTMALFLVNLFFSCIIMLRRVRSRLRTIRSFRDPEAIGALACHTTFLLMAEGGERLAEALGRRGYRVRLQSQPGLRISAVKRESGTWGVLFFHLTFFIVMLGAAISFLTRFSGYVELSPGEVFVEKWENYRRKTDRPLLLGHDRGFSLRLEEIDLAYWRPGEIKQRASVASVFDHRGVLLGREGIQVNNPLRVAGTNIYQGGRHGFIAGLEVSDEAGTILHIPIAFTLSEDKNGRLFQTVRLPGAGLALELELFTNRLTDIEGLEGLGSHSEVSLLKVNTLDSVGRQQFRGPLFGGAQLSFEGLTVKFASLKPYASFVLVRDFGIPVVFTGLCLLLGGLVVTYFWVPETLWFAVVREGDSERMVMGGCAEKYHESFSERFEEMADALRREING